MRSLRPALAFSLIAVAAGIGLTIYAAIAVYSPLFSDAGVLCGTIIAPDPDLPQSAQRPCAASAAERRPTAALTAAVAVALLLAGGMGTFLAARRTEQAHTAP
tara:strand:+ start:6146 stop:6454 length:309 start_codon:yes stop_codon:yes gene_type:complete